MKRCSLLCAGFWPFIVMPLLLLIPLLFFNWQTIEEDVASNVQADLASIGANWAEIETNNLGRDVLITGIPPNQAAIVAVKEKATTSQGVNRVVISSDVKAPFTPALAPELNTSITGDSIVLQGTLANQIRIDTLVTQAEQAFGKGNIISKLEVLPSTSALPNLDGFFLSLAGKSFALETLNAKLKDNQLTLNGVVNSDESKTVLTTQMEDTLGLEVNSNLSVVAPRVACQYQLNTLLSNGKINFASAKAVIQEDSFALLKEIKATSLLCPNESFEIAGHTDSIGNLDFNMKLSLQRARAVLDHLVGLGLDASKFTAAGYGPDAPIADNETSAGRAQNRRIEFKLKN